MAKYPSILMCVGRQFYTLYDYIAEAQDQGVSKRLPVNSLPPGLVKGLSKIFVAHPDAIVEIGAPEKTLLDLAGRLHDLGMLSNDDWIDPDLGNHPLTVAIALSRLDGELKRAVEQEFGITYKMGIFGYAPLSEVQYVLPHNEDALPDEHSGLQSLVDRGEIKLVHVEYDADENTVV